MAEHIAMSGTPNQGIKKAMEAIANGEFVGDCRHPQPGDNIKVMQLSDAIKVGDKAFIQPIADAGTPIDKNIDITFRADGQTMKAQVAVQVSDPEVDKVVEQNAEQAAANEDIAGLRKIQEEDNPNPEITSGTMKFKVNDNGNPTAIIDSPELKEAALPIDKIDEVDKINDKKIAEQGRIQARQIDLSDEEAENIAQILIEYRNNKSMNVYAAMCFSLKQRINQICFESGVPLSNANQVAKFMMDQFLSSASEEEEFIDIERTLEETMKMPSMIDIYMEHVNETMHSRLPAMAEAIREENPEQADKLMEVCEQYNAAFLFSRLRDMYDSSARIRKIVRKQYMPEDVARLGLELNHLNSKTKFKMPDCSSIISIVRNIVEHNCKDSGLDNADVCKFCALAFSAMSTLNLSDIVDCSYVYYTLKNISMMAYLGDGLTDFSAELISNMRITMYYIRIREDEFNEQHKNDNADTGRKQKRSVRKRAEKRR